MELTSERTTGTIASVVYVILVILLLLLLKLTVFPPEDQAGSIEMDFGFTPSGHGPDNPRVTPPVVQPPSTSPKEEVLTATESEHSVASSKEKRKKEDTENQRKETEQPVKKQTNPWDDVWNTSNSQSQGSSTNKGNEGSPEGSPGGKGTTPGKGYPGGTSLGNGDARTLPRPQIDSGEDGKVVVELCVDRNGNVTRVRNDRAKGTTAVAPELYSESRRVALLAKFDPDPNAPDCRVAFITYVFRKGFGD
jgi:outer membrane biosynthesis protein TonB